VLFETLKSDLYSSSAGRWYATLAGRDKSIVQLAAGFLILLILIVFVWMPVLGWSGNEVQRYRNSLALNEWIQSNEQRARQVSGLNPSAQGKNESLLAIISRSAKSSAITLLRFQEEGSGGVSVVLQEQVFNDIVAWLENLENKNRIQIRQISIDSHANPGKVNARIIFI